MDSSGVSSANDQSALVTFCWDKNQSSEKLHFEDDGLTAWVKDGSGFKNSIGDLVGCCIV